jgi:hypothetical protein
LVRRGLTRRLGLKAKSCLPKQSNYKISKSLNIKLVKATETSELDCTNCLTHTYFFKRINKTSELLTLIIYQIFKSHQKQIINFRICVKIKSIYRYTADAWQCQ